VLATAAAQGLHVVERAMPYPGVRGLLHALEDLHTADIVSLRSPVDPASRQLLFHSSHAVLANSGREPFGLVGLETMAAGGVACTGCSGEDYAVPGRNALVLETNDPQEFLGVYSALRADPTWEQALRRAGRTTAQQYRWSEILRRVLWPRLAALSRLPEPSDREETTHMRLQSNSSGGALAPHLLGEIAERLEALHTPQADIFEARVTLVRQPHGDQARVALTLAGKTLHVTHTAETQDAAVQAALHTVAEQLRRFRSLRRGGTVIRRTCIASGSTCG
jgi:ribosome-associated translation inhibitor RaiA